MSVLLPDVRRMPSGGRGLSNVLPSTEFGYPSGDGYQIRLSGGNPLKPLFKKKGRKRMSEFLAFMGGALFGVALMCCLQINRLADNRK